MSLEFTIGIAIYNKSHMIDLIIDSLAKNIVEPVEYIFIFDGCTDNSEQVFDQNKHLLNGNIRKIKTDNVFQVKTNNIFLESFTTDKLIIFQDDMVLNDKSYLENIRKIYNLYKEKVGIIGSRDGFEAEFSEMYSAEHSDSKPFTKYKLKPDEFKEVSMINIGPIVLNRSVVDKVGLFNTSYGKGGYEETEYALKCKYNFGLINFVLAINIIHNRFLYLVEDNKIVCGDLSSHNQYMFSQKWRRYWSKKYQKLEAIRKK